MKKPKIRLFPKIKPRRGTLEAEGSKGQRYCPNCHYPLPHYGEFCSNCGQRYTDGRVPLKYLLQDFIDNVLNIDTKFFRTVWSLALPGKLTNEFFKGHHKRFASPARLFFVATVIHFAVIGFVIHDTLESSLANMMEESKRRAYELPLIDSLEQARTEVEQQFGENAMVKEAMDSLFTQVHDAKRDSFDLNYFFITSNWDIERKDITLSQYELYNKDPAVLAQEKGITNKTESFFFQQFIKIWTHVDNFGQFVLGQLVWMVILMMPALALILKLLYIRRKRYFVEHLVFSFHYHAFAFWIVSIMLLVLHWTGAWEENYVPWVSAVPNIVVVGILIYLFIAMRRVYKQGFFKTLIKNSILNFAYVFIFSFFLVITFIISGLMF